jgi:hypothetical protein
MDEDEINAKLMLTLMKKMTPKVYVALRKTLVEYGLDDPLSINALIAEMDYVQDTNKGATLVIRTEDEDNFQAYILDGPLVSNILREEDGSESATGF